MRANAPQIIGTPTFVAQAVTQILSGNTANVALPGGGNPAGNLLLMFVGGNLSFTTFTSITFAGWTKVMESLSGAPTAVFYKKCEASEPASYPVSLDGTGVNAVNILFRVLEFSGVNADNPILFHQSIGPSNTNTMASGSMALAELGMLVSHTGHAGSSTFTNTWFSGASNDGFTGTTQRSHIAWRLVTNMVLSEYPIWLSGPVVSMSVNTIFVRAKTMYN